MAEKVVGQLVVTVDANTELAETRLKGLQASLKSLDYLDKDLSGITIGGNFLDQALKRVTGGFMQLIQGLSASAFRGAAGVFAGIASAGYDTAKSIETAHVAFETFLGSGEEADKLLKKIRKDAMITPFDVSGLAKATQKLLMVEKNGLAAEQTIMNLGKALTAAGKGDEQLANLTNYLQQIGINAKVTQRQISAFGTAGVDIIGMVAERQGIAVEKTKEWLQSISNPYEVIADAINAAGEAGGQFADVYNLMGGTIEQLTANLNDAIGTFGEATMQITGLDEQVKGVLRSLTNFFNVFEHPENVATVAASIKKLFGEFNAGSVVTNILNGITKALAAFNSGQFDNMIIFFKQFFGVLKQFAGVSLIGRSIKMILDLFSDNHTAAEVRKIATQLATLIKVIWEFRLIGKITSVFTTFARVAVKAFTDVGSAAFTMAGIIASIIGIFSSGGDVFGGLFNGVSDVVADVGKKSSDEANKAGKNIMKNVGDGAASEVDSTKQKLQDIYEELAKLQAQWVKEMGDMGAFDLKEQLMWYQKFQAEYAVGTKARMSMDEKVHDAELAISKDIISKVDEFNEVFNKAMKTAKDYYDMFEYTQVTLRRTAESVIEGLRRQNDNMLKYYQNLKKMSEMGFDADFMQYVYDSGMDAASEVAGLADATQEQIDEINEMWRTRGQIATDIAVLNTQQLKEETLAEVADLQSSLNTQVVDVYDSGTLLMRSFTEGIMDYMPTLEDAMANVAAAASGAGGGGAGSTGDFDWDWEDLMNYDDYEGLLDRMNIDAFEYGDAMGLLGEILKQNWALMLPGIVQFMRIIKEKVFDVRKNTTESVEETTRKIKDGVNEAKGSIGSLVNEIQKVYNCMWQIQNYKSVYDTAMNGVLGTTDKTTQQMVQLIDFVKGNYSSLPKEMKVDTKEATKAISDITVNGMDNINATTQKTLDKVRQACEYLKNDTATTMSETAQLVAGGVEKGIASTEKVALEAGKEVQKLAAGAEKHLLEAGDSVARIAEKSSVEVEKAVEKTVKKSKKKVAEGQTDMFAAFDKMEQEAKNTVAEVSTSAAEVAQVVADTAETEMRSVDSALSTSTDSALDKFYRIGNGAESGIRTAGNAFQSLGGMLDGVAPELANSMSSIGATLGSAAEIASNNVFTKFTQKAGEIKTWFGGLKDKVGTGFNNVVATPVTNGIEKLKGITTKKSAEAAAPIADIPKVAGEGVTKNSNVVVNAISKVTETISGVINSFVNIIFDVLDNVAVRATDLLTKIFGGLGKALKALVEPLADPMLLLGVAVLAGIAASIWLVADAVKLLAEAVKTIIEAFSAFIDVLAKMCTVGKTLDTSGMASIGEAIGAFTKIIRDNFGGHLWNVIADVNRMFQLATMIEMANNVDDLIDAVQVVIVKMKALEGLLTDGETCQTIESSLSGLKDIIDALQGLFSGGLISALWDSAKASKANTMREVAESVEEILGSVINIIEKFNFLKNGAGTEDPVGVIETGLDDIKMIIDKLQGLFGGGWVTALYDKAKTSKAETLSEVTTKTEEIIVHTANIIKKLSGLKKTAGTEDPIKTVTDGIADVKQIIDALQGLFGGGWIAAVWDKAKGDKANTLATVASAVDTIVGTVQSICNKMSELRNTEGGATEVTQILDEQVKPIVSKIADFFGGGWITALWDSAKGDKANTLATVASSLDTILGCIQSMCNKLKELKDQGYTVPMVQENLQNVKEIAWKLAEVEFSQSLDSLEGVAGKAGKLTETASSFDTILGTVQSICNKFKELKDSGNTPDSAKEIVGNVEGIVQKLAAIQIEETVGGDTVEVTAQKAEHVKKIAENINGVLTQVTTLVKNVQDFNKAYDGTSVEAQVKAVNTMLSKLIGDGSEDNPGITIPYTNISEEDVTKLGHVKTALQNIQEMAKIIAETPNVSKEILNVEAIVQFLSDSMAQMAEAIGKYSTDMESQGTALATAFINGWKSYYPQGTTAGQEMQTAVWQAIEDKMNDEYKQGEAFAQQILNGISNKTKASAYEAGHAFQSAVWSGVQDRISPDGNNDMYKQGSAMAGQMVSGLVNGINSRLSQVASGIKVLGQTAIDKLKDILDIHSPSRVMAEIGGQVSTGFAEGILDGLGTVSDAGESLAEAVMGGYDSAIEPLSASAVEARAWTDYEKGNAGAVAGGGHTANIVQNNNIYSQLDMDTAMNDLAWAVARS